MGMENSNFLMEINILEIIQKEKKMEMVTNNYKKGVFYYISKGIIWFY